MSDSLTNLDLNLLLTLEALVEEGQVTRAAKRLHVSQSAMSHALARLRVALGDEVVVRLPRGVQPTPRTLALAEPVRRALTILRDAIADSADFEPSTYRGRFRFATNDMTEAYGVPGIYHRRRNAAPSAQLELHSAAVIAARFTA